MLYIGLNRVKHEKIFWSETIRPRAMILGMSYHLVDYAPGAKMAPPGGSHILHWLI